MCVPPAAMAQALARHILWALEDDEHVPQFDPAADPDRLLKEVEESLLLPKFLHECVDEEALDMRALNRPKDGAPLDEAAKLQNHTLFVNAATAVGSAVAGLRPSQLQEARARPQLVMQQMYTLAHTELVGRLKIELMPELSALARRGESAEDLANVAPESFMLRWINYHLQAFYRRPKNKAELPPGCPASFRVRDLGASLADSTALLLVLAEVSDRDEKAILGALTEPDPVQRAKLLLDAARALGVESFVLEPEDIAAPRERLLLLFVAALMNAFPALEADRGLMGSPRSGPAGQRTAAWHQQGREGEQGQEAPHQHCSLEAAGGHQKAG